MSKKVSVVIPCYNSKKYIKETLQTVALQGDDIGEIIVVDDASLDGSAEYVEALDFPNVVVYRRAVNGGISATRNYGAERASCPYIAFLDADDLWPEKRTAELLAALENSNAEFAFGKMEHFISEDYAGEVNYLLPPVQMGYFASAMLVRAEFFRKVGMFNEAFKVGEFIDWYSRAKEIAAPALVESAVLRRRIHGANTSIISSNKNVNDYLKVMREAIARKKQSSGN